MDIMEYMFDQDNITRLYGIEQMKIGEKRKKSHSNQPSCDEYGHTFYRKSDWTFESGDIDAERALESLPDAIAYDERAMILITYVQVSKVVLLYKRQHRSRSYRHEHRRLDDKE